ncbi:amidohydrolase family protein [Candidatus Latescibacterota bacterium]
MKRKDSIPRRATLKKMGAIGSASVLGAHHAQAAGLSPKSKSTRSTGGIRDEIFKKVDSAPFIDTHEHLIEEHGRFTGTDHPRVSSDDWTMVLSHYLNSDILTSGMPMDDYNRLFSPGMDPVDKWKLLEPYWPYVKNTGYGQAVVISMRELYDVEELSAKTIGKIQANYEKVRRPGFYKYILCERSNIESCQVNSLENTPFMESSMPELLMQDISILGMYAGPNIKQYSAPTGIAVNTLSDWHRVIDWWFDRYGKYAVAAKSQNAYSRDINYDDVPAETAEPLFKKRVSGDSMTLREVKALEDHLFWYAARKSTEYNLPVKLHTGYYAGQNSMPLSRLINNPGSATDLCLNSPETTFVFMHICYPYYEELISIAKQFTNAHVDMCWSWIINPVAAKDFLKKYLVTAPANKIVAFGGDYIPVEPVLGHAAIARQGISLALSELVEDGWMSGNDALELVDPIMHENARRIFKVSEKERNLKNMPW